MLGNNFRPTDYAAAIGMVQLKKIDKVLIEKNNIDTRLSFPPIHLQPYYKKKFKYKKNDFPESEKTFESFVDIPCWMGMNNKQIKYVIKKIRSFFNKYE